MGHCHDNYRPTDGHPGRDRIEEGSFLIVQQTILSLAEAEFFRYYSDEFSFKNPSFSISIIEYWYFEVSECHHIRVNKVWIRLSCCNSSESSYPPYLHRLQTFVGLISTKNKLHSTVKMHNTHRAPQQQTVQKDTIVKT